MVLLVKHDDYYGHRRGNDMRMNPDEGALECKMHLDATYKKLEPRDSPNLL